MTPHLIDRLAARLARWRIARLTDRIVRVERWMEAMPISDARPTYGELAERVHDLRQELDRLSRLDAPHRRPPSTGFRPSVRTARF